MRTLEFEVKQQRLRKQPGCDFSHIVAGSFGYLKAKFYFSSEWDNCKKAASFICEGSDEEHAVLLDENNSCVIPSEALVGNSFDVFVTGVRPGLLIQTARTSVKQEVF